MSVLRVMLVLLSGCFLSHEVEGEVGFDAGLDAGPPDCVAADRFVSVEVSGETTDCALRNVSFFSPTARVDGGELVFDASWLINPRDAPRACTTRVRGLGGDVAEGFAARIATIADGFVELSATHFSIRDTSLCDGPAAEECPLVMEAESGGLRPIETFREVSIRWGDTLCTSRCGSLRALEFAYSLGERVDRATLRQGEINDASRSSVRFANLRSWNSCTDEGDTITWAFWLTGSSLGG